MERRGRIGIALTTRPPSFTQYVESIERTCVWMRCDSLPKIQAELQPASCCRASTTDRSITSSSWPEATRAPSPAGRSGRRTCCMCRRGPRGLAVRPPCVLRASAAPGRQFCNDTQLKTFYRIMSSLSALHHKMGKKKFDQELHMLVQQQDADIIE